MEQTMNTRKDEFSTVQTTVELALAELDQVSGGRKADALEIQYLNWVKQIYSPWANINFGGGRTMIA
jgi:hypothetical protein